MTEFTATAYGHDIAVFRPENDMLHTSPVEPQAVGCDEVLEGWPRGECGGVQMANQVIEAVSRGGDPVFGNHEPTHGADSTAAFTAMGARFDRKPAEIPVGSTYIISAHGAAPGVTEAATERGLNVLDVTCPLVTRTHVAIERAARESGPDTPAAIAYISLGSSPTHPELVGAAGLAEARKVPFHIVSNEEDATRLLQGINPATRLVIVGQTTNNSDAADELIGHIRSAAQEHGVTVGRQNLHDVCHTVRDRQRSVRAIVGERVGTLIVVGSVNSKNTKSLATVAALEARLAEHPMVVYLVNSWGQLPDLGGRVGLVSGASTRAQNVDGVITRLNPRLGVRKVGEDTDKGIVFSPIHAATRAILNS
ncbi:MAG: hypothetical protein ABWY71_01115 [Candidatus Saccharimonadales bacterium]